MSAEPPTDSESGAGDALALERRRRESAEAFLAVMSHELRTPITSISGNAALLARNPGRHDAEELIADMQAEIERLTRIVDDLLVLSGVDRGLLELSAEPVLLQHLVPQVIEDVLRRSPEVELRARIGPEVSPVVADTTALSQVLYNLTRNAAAYAGDEGPIELSARALGDEVEVVVRDHGPGLGSDPDSLFALFRRNPSTAGRTPGSGIGLYVVRELLRAMGSDISARSRAPHGAEFSFRLAAVADSEA